MSEQATLDTINLRERWLRLSRTLAQLEEYAGMLPVSHPNERNAVADASEGGETPVLYSRRPQVIVQQTPKAAHVLKDLLLVVLLMATAFGGGAALMEYKHWEAQQQIVPAGEGSLFLPAEINLAVGEPSELRAETRGRRVVWMPLDKEIALRTASPKSVWVWATEPGDYRIIAWTAVDNLPTVNALTVAHVTGKSGNKEKEAKK